MKLEHERAMFLTAMRHALGQRGGRYLGTGQRWAHRFTFMDGPLVATVFSPRGSTFKHRACVVQADYSLEDTRRVFANDFSPAFFEVALGMVNFYYEDGYDVLASTGAFAAIRREAESEVLR